MATSYSTLVKHSYYKTKDVYYFIRHVQLTHVDHCNNYVLTWAFCSQKTTWALNICCSCFCAIFIVPVSRPLYWSRSTRYTTRSPWRPFSPGIHNTILNCHRNNWNNLYMDIARQWIQQQHRCHAWSRNCLPFRSTWVHSRFSHFSFDYCFVCPSIYRFWLPLWYLQSLLTSVLLSFP